jgi:hypothetical protein
LKKNAAVRQREILGISEAERRSMPGGLWLSENDAKTQKIRCFFFPTEWLQFF